MDYLVVNLFMKDKTERIKSIDRKLSVVISLLSKIANNGNETTFKQQIFDLSSFGLSSAEIADILGKKVGYISKELSTLKKEGKYGK
jgi:hypothetical protein